MRVAFFTLLGVLGLTACASFDPYLPRESQCVLLGVAKTAAAAKGVDVDTYLNTNNLFVCEEVSE